MPLDDMKPLTYSLQFRGLATPIATNLVRLELTAPSSALVTTIGPIGVRTRFGDVLGSEAVLRSEARFLISASFDDRGAIDFGGGHLLRFRTVCSHVGLCPDPGLTLGAVVREILGGDGQFAGSVGLVASSFLISDTGEVTENQFGLVFVREEEDGLLPRSGSRQCLRVADR